MGGGQRFHGFSRLEKNTSRSSSNSLPVWKLPPPSSWKDRSAERYRRQKTLNATILPSPTPKLPLICVNPCNLWLVPFSSIRAICGYSRLFVLPGPTPTSFHLC